MNKPKDPVRIFVANVFAPPEYDAFFEDTVGDEETPAGGYLYVLNRDTGKVIRHLEIYRTRLDVKEEDIEILWSSDSKKCGISIWGRMRGIVDLANDEEVFVRLVDRESPAITDPIWLQGFDDYLDQNVFVRARQRYWKTIARQFDPSVRIGNEDQTPVETDFILCANGPDDLFAVFEDNGETGYLYLYNSNEQQIVQHLLIYDRSEEVNVVIQDIWIGWSDDGDKCGVAVWGRMRGIINRVTRKEGRIKLEARDTPGISDRQWLKGFEYLFKPN